MNKFDRYLLSQFMALFGFFALVLVSVYWVNRAVVLFDQLIGDGQSVWVFFEFTALTLPNVIKLIIPIAVFAAACYGTSRQMADSELTVMQATGFSPWRLARPVLTFGVLVALMMAVLANFLVPLSFDRLDNRQREIAENATARLLTEGAFIHPNKDITFYIQDITQDGILKNIFMFDQSTDDRTLIHSASEAYLVRDAQGPKLIMVQGLTQVMTDDDRRLFTTNFGDFTYDISAFLNHNSNQTQALERITSPELWRNGRAIAENFEAQHTQDENTRPINGLGWLEAERHGRIAFCLMCIMAAMVGFSTLLLGGFSRFGVWPQVVLAFILLAFLEALKNAIIPMVRIDPNAWPLLYLPAVFGASLSALMLASKSYVLPTFRRATS